MPVLPSVSSELSENRHTSTQQQYITRILKVTTIGTKDETKFQIEFELPSKQLFKACYNKNCELIDFVKDLENEFKELNDCRFIHKQHMITLKEKQEDVWTLKGPVHVYINKMNEYLVDLNNQMNQEGNLAFREKDYRKAIEKYTIALSRYPNNLKSLCNRALSYYRAGEPAKCIKDLNHFLELVKNHETEEKELIEKAYFRRGRGYFALAQSLTEASSSSDDEYEREESFSPNELIERYLKLLGNAAKDFAMVSRKEFEKKMEVSAEFDTCLNAFILSNNVPPCCILCRKRCDELVKAHVIPDQLLSLFKNLRVEKQEMFCTECHQKISSKEKLFIEKVWNVIYKDKDSIRNEHLIDLNHDNTLLYYFAASVTFKNMMMHEFKDLKFFEKPYTSRKIFNRLRQFLLAPDPTDLPTTFVPPKCYMFVAPLNNPNEDEFVLEYLDRFNVDYCLDNLDRVQFMHTQFKQLHICMLVSDEGIFGWDSQYKISIFKKTLKIPKDDEREWISSLISYVISILLFTNIFTQIY